MCRPASSIPRHLRPLLPLADSRTTVEPAPRPHLRMGGGQEGLQGRLRATQGRLEGGAGQGHFSLHPETKTLRSIKFEKCSCFIADPQGAAREVVDRHRLENSDGS